MASDPRPRDDRDAAHDLARGLAEFAAHIGHLKDDANAYFTDPRSRWSSLRERWQG
jgi:hypothetical protein